MSRPPCFFTFTDIRRAWEAAKKAGIVRPMIEVISPKTGVTYRFLEAPEGSPPAAPTEPQCPPTDVVL